MNLPDRGMDKEEQKKKIQKIVSTLGGEKGEYNWGVYTLRCEQPVSNHRMKKRLSSHYPAYPVRPIGPEYGPDWAELALHSDVLYYVGQSNDVANRILKHVRGEGALFAKLFPPKSVEDVEWYGTESDARTAELETSREINQNGENPVNPSLDDFSRSLKGRINNSAEYVAEDFLKEGQDGKKINIFCQWMTEFRDGFNSGMVKPELRKGADKWMKQASIEEPSYPDNFLKSSGEIIQFWEKLTNDRVDEYLDEIEMLYAEELEKAKSEPITFCYSM